MGDKFAWLLSFLQFLIPADFFMVYQILIVLLSFSFIGVVFWSIYKNRGKGSFYQMICRQDDQERLSKVGISYIFILVLIVFQTVTNGVVDGGLIQLLGVVFAAEIGTKYVGKIVNTKSKKDFTEKRDGPRLKDDDWDDI